MCGLQSRQHPPPYTPHCHCPLVSGPRLYRAQPEEDAAAADSAGDGGKPLQEQAGAFSYGHIADNLERMDANQLQTALATAIAAEDYALAAAVRDRFTALMASDAAGGSSKQRMLDWQACGLPEWIADRAARLSLRFPTGD